MAFCSRCGTEIQNGVKFCPECGTSVSAPENGLPAKERNGTVLFWLCFFLGGYGIHQFYAGNTRRGLTYLLVLLLAGWLVVPALVIGVLALIDLWRISKGTFRSGDGVRYLPAHLFHWAVIIWSAAILLCIVCAVVAVPKLMDFAAKSQAEELVAAAEEYMKLQNANVAESGNIGSWEAVGYKAPGERIDRKTARTESFTYYDPSEDGENEVWRATSNIQLGSCPGGSVWRILITGEDAETGTVEYSAVSPGNPACAELAPSFAQIK